MSTELMQVSNQIGRVANLVAEVDHKVNIVAGAVDQVNSQQVETRNELAQLRNDFLQYVLQAERTANIQRAETRLGVIQDQVDHEFGHYKVVRRSATGILQAFDVGLVSEAAVQNISEQLMIQSPRYWLAPALVALAAWAADDEPLCNRAVEEAFRRAPGKTSLFFALVTRRQARLEASVRWLRHFLAAQDPRNLGRDFAVVLESMSQGAFGPAGRDLVTSTMHDWRQLLMSEATTEEQINLWIKEIEGRSEGSSTSRYPNLATTSPQWPVLDEALGRAGAHANLLSEYGQLLQEEFRPNERLEDAVDDILDRLVSEFDAEELPLRRELAFNEAVVARNGDLDAAKADADLKAAALEETLDYLTIQSMSALRPDAIGVSRATQRVAVSGCADWFQSAHDRFARNYRALLPSDVEAKFDTSHSVGAAVFQLPEWRASFTRPMADLEASFASHWDRAAAPFIDSLRYNWQKKALVPGIVMVLALILFTAVAGVGGLLVALVGAGIWAFVLYQQKEKSERAVAAAQKALDGFKQESIHKLRAAAAELTDWQSDFEVHDAQSDDVEGMIKQYRTATAGASPYEKRVAAPTGVMS